LDDGSSDRVGTVTAFPLVEQLDLDGRSLESEGMDHIKDEHNAFDIPGKSCIIKWVI
jgi:hypothetical protein